MIKGAPRSGPSVTLLALLFSALGTGCTFYTACPTGNNGNNNNPGAGGASGGSAGNGSGGGGVVPTGEWTNASGNLAGIPSECGNMSGVAAKPDEDLLIASISQNGLWASTDGGTSWDSLGTGKRSDTITNRMSNIVFDPDDSKRWWEGGIYNGGGVFETTDNGVNFTMLGDLDHQGDYLSVDLSDPDRQTLIIGGHESSGVVMITRDAGSTWSHFGAGLPTGTNCSVPLIIDSQTFLVGCGGFGGGVQGIFRSANGGKTWKKVTGDGGSRAPLRAADKTIYWLSANGAMTRSVDDGVTWTLATPAGTLVGPGVVELPDGRIAALAKRYVMISADKGDTWSFATSALPYDDSSPASGVDYSKAQKAFFIWHFTCGFNGPVPVPDDAVMRYDFDYEAP